MFMSPHKEGGVGVKGDTKRFDTDGIPEREKISRRQKKFRGDKELTHCIS